MFELVCMDIEFGTDLQTKENLINITNLKTILSKFLRLDCIYDNCGSGTVDHFDGPHLFYVQFIQFLSLKSCLIIDGHIIR